MSVIEQLGLRHDPFGPASGVSGCGVALSMLGVADQLVAAVRRGDPLIVLVGRPGMGKTLLLGRLEQICRADGIEVYSIARGDMAHKAFGTTAQLLIVDEADTINAATLKALAPGTPAATAPTVVFGATRPDLHRIAGDVRTTIVELRPLNPAEAQEFLMARATQAGRADLFAPDALDVIVEAGRGSPRLLRVLAGAAMFQAASDGATQITSAHASLAATMHGSVIGRPEPAVRVPVAANDVVPFVRPAEGGHPSDNVVPLAARPAPARRRVGLLPFAASVALAALILPASFSSAPNDPPFAPTSRAPSAKSIPGPVQLAAAALTDAPANAAVPRRSSGSVDEGWVAPLKFAAVQTVPITREAVRTVTAAINSGPPLRLQAADFRDLAIGVAIDRTRVDAANRNARTLLADVRAGARVRPGAIAQANDRSGRSGDDAVDDEARLAATLAAASIDSPAIVASPASIAAAISQAVTGEPVRPLGDRVAVAQPIRTASLAVEPAAPSRPAVDATLPSRVATASAGTARDVAEQTRSGRDGADAAKEAKLASNQGKSAKETAKQAAEQAKASKQSASQAKEAKESAEQAKAAKESSERTKAARLSSEQARAAKEALEEAKAAKRASDEAKTVKQAAEQAKSGKEASELAKAAKEAAEQAKAAKEAAEQAKAAKESAEQAKVAKEAAEAAKDAKAAADQAKAAKGAAEQAKAAKEAAEQAKAAKEAAEQAKLAKNAADQAKAAKEAADQAKAAKDAAEQAKAVKESADMARAAKESADQARSAKDASRTARDAKEASRSAKEAREIAKSGRRRD